MSSRRFTRLTNAFSKKLAHYEAAVALHFLQYDFVRVHGSLGTTPTAGSRRQPLSLDVRGDRCAAR